MEIKKNLQAANISLRPRDNLRLNFPSPYLETQQLKKMSCANLHLMARNTKKRQNKVYQELTTGTLKNIPFPQDKKIKLSNEDISMIEQLKSYARCLPPEKSIGMFCAVGTSLFMGTKLPKEIRDLLAQRKRFKRKVKIKAKVRADIHRSQMVGNLRFPQTSNGITATLVSKMLREGYDAKSLSIKPSAKEIKAATKVANNAHKTRRVGKKVSTKEVHRVLSVFAKGTPERIAYVQRILAVKNSKGLKLVAMNSPNHPLRKLKGAPSHTSKGYANQVNQFNAQQSAEGTAYLKEVGASMDRALWDPEMKKLSKLWQDNFDTSTGKSAWRNMNHDMFVEKFNTIMKKQLLADHPELNASISKDDIQAIFGTFRPLKNIEGRSKVDLILNLFDPLQ